MRALVVSPQPFFLPRGTPFSVYYRALITAELGAEIDLLTYGSGQDVDIPGVRIHRIPAFRFLGPVPVGPSILKLFLDVFMVIWMVGLCLRRRYDFVHAHEEAIFFARLLKPLFRYRLVYDMHSCLPQQLINFRFTTSRFWIGLFEKLEDGSLRSADAVITICPELADYAIARMPDPRRHFLIENSIFEPVRLKDPPPAAHAAAAVPSGRRLVVYAGTFEPYQGLEILIHAFARVVRRRDDVFLILVGGTPAQVEEQRALARECGLNGRCEVLGRMDQQAVRQILRRADVQVSPRRDGNNTPLKVYEQLASGIPIVATRIRSHTQVLDDDVSILVAPDPDAMAAGILAALEDERRRERVVRGARELYEREYARAVYVSKMRRLLDLLGGRAAAAPEGAEVLG